MSFEIHPGNQNPLETGYCPKFLLYHLFVDITDDAFFWGRAREAPFYQQNTPCVCRFFKSISSSENRCLLQVVTGRKSWS